MTGEEHTVSEQEEEQAAAAPAAASPPPAPDRPAPEGPDEPAVDEAAVDEPAVAEPSAAEAAVEEAAVAEAAVEEDLDALRERASRTEEYLALAQRTQADFENYRKRMVREVGAAEARGIARLTKELLPALDNLDRALAAAESHDGEYDLTDGIRLVQAELSAALARSGIEGYEPQGEPFDPAHHEAVAQRPVEGAESGTIVEVLQSGYRLNDALLRPARVVVAA